MPGLSSRPNHTHFPLPGSHRLKVIYTNADQLVNKRDDLCMAIAGREPDIILITEVILKA